MQPLQQGHGGRDGGALALDRAEVHAPERAAQHVLDERDGAARELAQGVAPVRRHEVGRVLALGQDQDDGLDREGLEEREGALGCPRAGLVRVERQHDALREPGRETEVTLAERGAARGDGVLEARA